MRGLTAFYKGLARFLLIFSLNSQRLPTGFSPTLFFIIFLKGHPALEFRRFQKPAQSGGFARLTWRT
jgi:hypothetical protein